MKIKLLFALSAIAMLNNPMLADNVSPDFPEDESGETAETIDYASWMKNLSSGAYIDQVSIPGTHDAGTGNGTSSDNLARTQELSLEEQFRAGVRAFDLRPAAKGNTLQIYHGAIKTNVSFEEALDTFVELLNENSSEFVVIVMRHEDDSEGDADKENWGVLMNNMLMQEKYAEYLKMFASDLTVMDMRGKILVLSRDSYATTPVGGYISGWTHSENFDEQKRAKVQPPRKSVLAVVQDYYEMENNEQQQIKADAIKTVLDYSTQLHTKSGHNWVINHTSGYYASSIFDKLNMQNCYRKNAAVTNIEVVNYLADEDHAGPIGLVMMDFAGVDRSGSYDVNGKQLVEAIVANNFRYTMRGIVTGVEEVSGEGGIRILGNEIMADGEITVYRLDGTRVADGENNVSISVPGLYIVRSGSHSEKVIIR